MSSDYESLKETLLLLSAKRFRRFLEFCEKQKDYDVRYEELLIELNAAAKETNNWITKLYGNIT